MFILCKFDHILMFANQGTCGIHFMETMKQFSEACVNRAILSYKLTFPFIKTEVQNGEDSVHITNLVAICHKS
jgi:hypothetical protein